MLYITQGYGAGGFPALQGLGDFDSGSIYVSASTSLSATSAATESLDSVTVVYYCASGFRAGVPYYAF